jgi:hypothetical protein
MGMEGDYRWDERNNMDNFIEDRVSIKEKMTKYDEPCDLCDEFNYPMIGWCCKNDDPAHFTSICIPCLKELNKKYG